MAFRLQRGCRNERVAAKHHANALRRLLGLTYARAMRLFSQPKKVATTPFSEFIRNASSAEKKKVYKVLLERATVRQQRVLREAAATK